MVFVRNLQTGSIVCSYPIAAIDEVFDGPYLTFNKDSREWESKPNQNFNVSFICVKVVWGCDYWLVGLSQCRLASGSSNIGSCRYHA